MDAETIIRSRIAAATSAMREFQGTEAHKQITELLQALEDGYKHDLTTVSVEGLVRVQTALRQVSNIRQAICRDSSFDARI